jgi:hypothetical protein
MKLLMSLAILLFSFGLVYSQETKPAVKPAQPPEVAPKPAETKPTLEMYEEVLTKLKKWSDNFDKEAFWKDAKLRNKETDKVSKFQDLSPYERGVFMFMTGEKLSNELKRFDNLWQGELKKFDGTEKKEEGKGKERAAVKEDVVEYTKQLTALRKATAVKFESYAEKFFKDFKDKFTEDERTKYMNNIREFHDNDKLIERKK